MIHLLLTSLHQPLHHRLHLLVRNHSHHPMLPSIFSIHLLSYDGYRGVWCVIPSIWGCGCPLSLPSLCAPRDKLVLILPICGSLISLSPPLKMIPKLRVPCFDSNDPCFIVFFLWWFVLIFIFFCVVQSVWGGFYYIDILAYLLTYLLYFCCFTYICFPCVPLCISGIVWVLGVSNTSRAASSLSVFKFRE